ncbi:MAG: cytochrome c3 family protein [Kofleriaceae bacterium]
MTIARLTVLMTLVVALGKTLVIGAPDRTGSDAGASWSPVVYPSQRLPLTFSHKQHLARGATCVQCHPAATTSRSAVDNLIPTEAACRGCHPIDRSQPDRIVTGAPVAACRGCHPGWTPGRVVERVYLPPPPLKFAHAAHAAIECARCHGDMATVELATPEQLPTMASCLSCHPDGARPERCGDCHLQKRGGLVETQFPHGELVPRNSGLGDAHGPDFERRHAQEASQVGASCHACHDQSECVSCHQGVAKPFEFHPGNYLLTHGVDARRGKPDCSACHRAQSFCVGCHERTGVAPRITPGFDAGGPFHPAGWATAGVGPNRHAAEARRNIASCASCHRENDCLSCHRAAPGQLRASPHPPGWRGSARCNALDRGNRRMCLRCHITAAELGCNWSAR